VVEGQVKADLKDCKVLYITSSGLYEGAADVDDADISGRFDGDLTVKGTLILRASGRVSGTLRYAELEIERGGRVSGTLGDIPAPAAAAPAGTAATPSPSENAAVSKAPKVAAGTAAKAAPRAAPRADDDLVARAQKPGSSTL
jgi:cytoskeletal protein CcmA (bactofilin family)